MAVAAVEAAVLVQVVEAVVATLAEAGSMGVLAAAEMVRAEAQAPVAAAHAQTFRDLRLLLWPCSHAWFEPRLPLRPRAERLHLQQPAL